MAAEKIKILLAEDDTNLGMILKDSFDSKGYLVTLCKNGDDALITFKNHSFNLCLLDVMMPIKDGFTVAKEIRTVNASIPIIFLTAKSMKEDVIEGFKSGADDYISKPFSFEELLLRVQAVLKRTQTQIPPTETEQTFFKVGDYVFDYQHQTVKYKNQDHQKLTSKEADLLRLLCIHLNNVMERSFALKSIWGDDSYFNARSMDVYIAKLRKYLSKDSNIEIINVHGKGFKMICTKV
ncbi:MAG: response regulator transcription factor [Bacteroidia bacterium]|nr:response regulator transcription factor [Bacteroidia bacterium]